MIEIITSLQNKFVKLAASLKQKKYRDELGLFVVEGVRLVEEAVQSDWLIETCIYTEETLEQERVQRIIADLQSKNCRMIQVASSIYEKVTDTKEPQGIMAIVKKNVHSLEDRLEAKVKEFFIVLDEVQDPGNVGTMIRTAAAAGCTGVILTKGCADVFASKAVRGSMGSIFHVPIIEGLTRSEVISYLKEHDIEILATSLESSKVYFEIDFKQSLAIVFGNEGNGVSQEFIEKAQERLYIPLANHVESLNVAASAAVILYEVVRQRR
ncbi:TrmH family RNA methyltransferase [Pelosinus sp. sgz500959]|uniref:TrmH family RNA methyltransferase n=1 Tax=Pelosinus sp. sgz500959 TaxID=3242472 RepID=UPI00366C4C8A